MPAWKKVIVSGSNSVFNNITASGAISSSGIITGATLTMGTTPTLTNAGLVLVANQPNITGVGTIGTGVWNGDALTTDYIANDAITEDKLADTLLAEIDANTGKNTNVVGNLGVVANGTSLTITTANGSNISIPEATTSAWGAMSDGLVSAIAANSAKNTNVEEPDAAEETKGKVALATDEEATAGTDATKALTPRSGTAMAAAVTVSKKVHELTAPTAALAMNSQKITGVLNPTAAQDAATKAYTDAKTWNGDDITAGTVVSARLDADTAHLSGAQTFTGTKTLNSFKGTGGATVTNILDEDAMGSDSATALATQQSIKAYVDNTHTTTQTGKNYRIINASFRDDIATTKHYVPLKSQDEQTALTREEGTELAVCDGRLVSATVRVESMNGTTGDFTLTMGVETNAVGTSYTSFSGTSETEVLTVNTGDDHHVFHFVFDTAKHWDATDMFAVSIQASSDEWGSNERFFVTLVIEDDWSSYLAGTSREIDSTP